MEVLRLDARTDFRLEKLAGQQVWYVPADDAADRRARRGLAAARRQLERHAAGAVGARAAGSACRAPRWAWRGSSSTICASSRWRRADYLRIAHEFHTLIIDRIPVMGFDQRNAAKRFIILIDTLYDHAVKLVASAAAEPDALYQASDGFEAAEFKRTASRLIEMRSQTYLALPHGRRDSAASGSSEGIVET